MELGIKRRVNIYLKRKDKETAIKKREEKIKAIVKELMLDKTPKQVIEMFNEVVSVFNDRLDEELKRSVETVECITKYKKL